MSPQSSKRKIVAVHILIAFYWVCVSCNLKTQPGQHPAAKKTIIGFENRSLMLGRLSSKKDRISVSFKVFNRGKNPLKIYEVTSDCHCTIPRWDTTQILPNGSSYIHVAFAPNMLGPMEQKLLVVSNGSDIPETLIFRAIITQ